MGNSPDVTDREDALSRARIGHAPDIRNSSRRNDTMAERTRFGRRAHQGRRHRGPDRPALVRRARQRQRGQDGHWRHQRQGRPAGRHVELYLEDSETTDAVAAANAAKLVEQDHVDVILGGIYSSTRQAIKGPAVVQGQDALHLPGAIRGTGMRPAHLLHRPGAGAAGRSVHSLADAADRREEVLPAVGRLHLAAHDEPESPRGRHGQRRRDRRRGVLPARSRRLRRTVERDRRRAAPRWSSTRSFLPGSRRSSSSCTTSGFTQARRAPRLHLLRRELPEHGAGRARRGSVQLPRLLPGRQRSLQPEAARSSTTRSIPGPPSSRPAARAQACTAVCGSGRRR